MTTKPRSSILCMNSRTTRPRTFIALPVRFTDVGINIWQRTCVFKGGTAEEVKKNAFKLMSRVKPASLLVTDSPHRNKTGICKEYRGLFRLSFLPESFCIGAPLDPQIPR